MTYEIEKRGKKFVVIEIENDVKKDLQSFTARSAAQLHIKRLEKEQPAGTTANPTGETPQTEQKEEKKPERKLSGSDFAMYYLCEHPQATEADLKKAIADAGLKMSDTILKTWPPFMAKIFTKLDELGWKRPSLP